MTIAKPPGPSSARVTNQVRAALPGRQTAGHAGTLDPLASGLLVIGIGAATRFIRFLPTEKRYAVEALFGLRTTTLDKEGETVAKAPVPADLLKRVHAAIPAFIGSIRQRAPSFSALKYQGKPLYTYARNGVAIPPKVRTVAIKEITVVSIPSAQTVRLDVTCGPGTYIRSLVADLGDAVGCGATMTGLVRTTCCGCELGQALSLTTADEQSSALYVNAMRPTASLLAHLPKISLDCDETLHIQQGRPIPRSEAPDRARLHDSEGEFIGIGTWAHGELRPLRLLPQAAT